MSKLKMQVFIFFLGMIVTVVIASVDYRVIVEKLWLPMLIGSVALLALTLILGVMKNLPRLDSAARDGQWARFPMRELSQKTVGIVGFGRIGKRLAELLRGFNSRILAYDPYVSEEVAAQFGAEKVTLEQLLGNSDVVSLHLPYTPENHHLINDQTLAMMKDGAYLVNTARGPLVDEKALYNALNSGKLSGAALDVFEKEPITKDNPLFTLENAVYAPHVSALSFETNYNGSIICAQSIIQVANGGKPLYPLW
jgi:D-3-phosphoglycerate dehydrogenase